MPYRNFAHPRGWNRPQVRQFIDKEFRRHPSIAEIIRRDPPFFTSNHGAFFARRSPVQYVNGRNAETRKGRAGTGGMPEGLEKPR